MSTGTTEISNEVSPQTDEVYLLELKSALSAEHFGAVAAAQGKDTYGFLPVHPFLPLLLPTVFPCARPGGCVFAPADCGSLLQCRQSEIIRIWLRSTVENCKQFSPTI